MLWTLPVEMQMYLFLPVIFLFVQRVTSARILLVLWCISAIGGYGVTALLRRLTVNRVVMTFDWGWIASPRLLEFVPYFLSGVLAYAFWRRGGRTVPFWMFACVLGALATAYPILLEISAPGRSITVFSVAAIGFGLGILLPRVREPVWQPLVASCATIARYSFSIYLIHVPCIWFGFDVLAERPGLVQWAAFLGSLVTICWFLYRFVERPGIAVAMARATTDDLGEKKGSSNVADP